MRMWKKGVASVAGLPLRYDLRSTQGASSDEGNGNCRVGASNIVFQHSPASPTQAVDWEDVTAPVESPLCMTTVLIPLSLLLSAPPLC